MKEKFCTIIGTTGGMLAAAFGGWDTGLQILLAFMTADFITGLLVAGVFHRSGKSNDGKLDSHRCFQGICRKIGMLILVGAANAMDVLLESTFLRNAVIIGFCASEVLSLTENAGLMGVPLPQAWRNAVSVLSQKSGQDDTLEK